MSENPVQKETLVQYLLGSLSGSETERLDELSIADDGFVESLRVAEYDLIDAYVAGDLSSTERQRFDSYYLAGPHNRDRVLLARALKEWSGRGVSDETTTFLKPASPGSWFGWFGRPRVALRWAAMAAVVTLFVVAGVLLFQKLRTRSRLPEAQASREELQRREQETQRQIDSQRAANATTEQENARRPEQQPPRAGDTRSPGGRVFSFSLSPPMRGAAGTRTITIPADTNTVRVRLEVEADYPAYRVQLLDSTQQTVWHSGSIKPLGRGDRKLIELSLVGSLLKSGNYVLRVSGGEEIVGDYSFGIAR